MVQRWIAGFTLIIAATNGTYAQVFNEGYYLFLGNYPNNSSPGFHRNVQGLAHDADHWFITQLHLPSPNPPLPPLPETGAIWRIPVNHDLNDVSPNDPGVTRTLLSNYPALAAYNHVGDIVYHQHAGLGFLILPLEGDDVTPAFAVLDANAGMTFRAITTLNQLKCGWVAVDAEGYLFTSESHPNTVLKYAVNWDALATSNPIFQVTLTGSTRINDESGAPLQLHHAQGGEFSSSGDLLYMSTGYYTDTDPDAEGIHVFDTRTWRRVQHSTNGYGHFNFAFEPGGVTAQEPEGLTIWDLDGGRAPGIRGQLHVLLLDNSGVFADEMFIKHYTYVIHVDSSHTGPEDGTPNYPFRTFGGAANLAWNGSEIRAQHGVYSGPVTIERRVRVVANNGIVRIGG